MTIDLKGRLALVTGASRGIGYFTALELAKAGAHVIACARTVGGLEELDDAIKAVGGTATLVPFDLTDMTAIDRLGGSIYSAGGKLDILVANAGILGVISPVGHIEAKVFDKVMLTNVTATWRLIRSVEPLLLKSDAGRALLLSSGVATMPAPSGAPMPPPRRRSKCWPHLGGRNQAVETSGHQRQSGRDPHRHARTGHAGRGSTTLPHPSEVAQKLVPLCSPEMTETGRLYVVRQNKFVDYRLPE